MMDALISSNLETLLHLSVQPSWSVADVQGKAFPPACTSIATCLSSGFHGRLLCCGIAQEGFQLSMPVSSPTLARSPVQP